MVRPGFRFKLRSLMVVVVLVAVGLGIEVARRRRAEYRRRAAQYAIAEDLSRRERERMLKSIEFQLDRHRQEGSDPNWEVGSLPMFRRLAEKHAQEAEEQARMKRYYETRW